MEWLWRGLTYGRWPKLGVAGEDLSKNDGQKSK
jgi:hypothetical protein